MVSFILPGNSATGGYDVANSLRFNDGSNDSLTKSFGSAGNRAVWTWSGWLKFSTTSGFVPIFTAGNWSSGSTATGFILYEGQFYSYWNAPSGGTATSGKYRDTSAWYHVVLQANTSTLKLFINSEEQTSRSISGDGEINNSSSEQGLGKYSNATSAHFDGYMAEVVFVDGQALAPTSFGEFDEDSPTIWKPKDVSGLTFGTNGFYLDFENSGSLGADVSGNGNNFTVNNLTSIDQSTDTCTNNFATLISNFGVRHNTQTYSNGNLTVSDSGGGFEFSPSTIAPSSGKWYFEAKMGSKTNYPSIGFQEVSQARTNNYAMWQSSKGYALHHNGEIYRNNSSEGDISGSYTTGDILSVALDLDNGKAYFAKNGTFLASANPASGSNLSLIHI